MCPNSLAVARFSVRDTGLICDFQSKRHVVCLLQVVIQETCPLVWNQNESRKDAKKCILRSSYVSILDQNQYIKLHFRVSEKSVSTFRLESKNRFDALKDKELTVEKMNKTLRESVDIIQKQTKHPINRKSAEDTEIETLVQKEFKQTANKTLKG